MYSCVVVLMSNTQTHVEHRIRGVSGTPMKVKQNNVLSIVPSLLNENDNMTICSRL
jgi:hypothetical protein